MKKIICLILCVLFLIPAMASCSRAPEYVEIEGRFRELVEASAEINRVLFGTGLATYERVIDPRSSTKYFTDPQTGAQYHYYIIEDNTLGEVIAFRQAYTTKVYEEGTKKYFYYEALDDAYGTILVINSADGGEKLCLQMLSEPKAGETAYYQNIEKGRYGYLLEGYDYQKDDYAYVEAEDAPRAEAAYYQNDAKGRYYYLLTDYVEPTYESFYDEDDPADYDIVRFDEIYRSVEEIKEAAEKVYSAEYLEALYETLFVGTAAVDGHVSGRSARYIEYADAEDGTITLMKSNTYEPLITETRMYDFSTAKMVRPSNGKYVNIEVESYLPSAPENRLTVRLSMILQDGVWMLDNGTY